MTAPYRTPAERIALQHCATFGYAAELPLGRALQRRDPGYRPRASANELRAWGRRILDQLQAAGAIVREPRADGRAEGRAYVLTPRPADAGEETT